MIASPYLSYDEAAAYLHVSRRFLERLVSERRVAYLRLGGKVLFQVADLDAYAQAGRIEPATVDAGHAFAERRNRTAG